MVWKLSIYALLNILCWIIFSVTHLLKWLTPHSHMTGSYCMLFVFIWVYRLWKHSVWPSIWNSVRELLTLLYILLSFLCLFHLQVIFPIINYVCWRLLTVLSYCSHNQTSHSCYTGYKHYWILSWHSFFLSHYSSTFNTLWSCAVLYNSTHLQFLNKHAPVKSKLNRTKPHIVILGMLRL